ncbi:MAG: SDR family oxidoreductase [Gemmatimonadetes bacterium]|uniref:SDR family oxidoreductase n=1 Tax=Candidatus Kutchimonas denitrificans TaxID=3056748 RepID=A0AAE5CBY9_9BACT|nr:SDR family oxidoreductase [Gemmatimonadota bacterium]NIR75015.1 SDR family oxidoreductase [Candidatus Kutchimonas denitrificans]NIS01598.1 SDR family oxidoreductase [Gemmatimonadota bacterium]NIT67336.1 SDR family oxidoreductase [Gemmatimonadota bacterium]NIU52699.1 SDR family oxidoreductase [Gemmatimonadota bacterium]
MIDLKGKRAIVTGASRGIGRATALMLARAGADVGFAYHTRDEDAETVVAEIQQAGRQAWSVGSDLGVRQGADQLFAACDDNFGWVDIFVANAGIWPPEHVALVDMTDETWTEMMRANLDSVFYTVRGAARRMADGGRIVIVSSTAGQRGEAGHSHYAATKGAVIAFVKSLAVELASRDITVNAVAPGWIDTEMAAPALAEEGMRDQVVAEIPLGRIGSADDVAGPIVFLCSKLARHITGEVLNVNGGSVLCG